MVWPVHAQGLHRSICRSLGRCGALDVINTHITQAQLWVTDSLMLHVNVHARRLMDIANLVGALVMRHGTVHQLCTLRHLTTKHMKRIDGWLCLPFRFIFDKSFI